MQPQLIGCAPTEGPNVRQDPLFIGPKPRSKFQNESPPDRELEMLYGYGRFLLPHLQLDRGATIDLGDEVDLQYYRLSLEFSGATELGEGEA
jgi:hypothetical protein